MWLLQFNYNLPYKSNCCEAKKGIKGEDVGDKVKEQATAAEHKAGNGLCHSHSLTDINAAAPTDTPVTT